MKSKKRKMNEKEKQNNIILLCLLVILIILLIILSIKKMFYNNNYYKIESRLDNLEKMKSKETDKYKIYGWIRIQGTNIDYPLIGSLTEDFSNPVNIEKFGWIMPDNYHYNNVINVMGHNILNLGVSPVLHDDSFKRFEELMDFVYFDFAKENKYIQLTMDGKEYLYQIFAAGIMDGYSYMTLPSGEYNEKEINEYLKLVNDNSIYDYSLKVNNTDKFITIATCTRMFGNTNDDFYVAGRLIEEKSKVFNYSVKKNEKYKRIQDLLKGADSNDKKDNA